MFTGLVAARTVESLERDGDGVRLRGATAAGRASWPGRLGGGQRRVPDGVEPDAEGFSADVMAETLRRSSLGPLARRGREPRAAAARRRPPRRPHRPGPRGRHRHGRVGARGGLRAGADRAAPTCCATSSRRARSPSTACRLPCRPWTTRPSRCRSSPRRSSARRSAPPARPNGQPGGGRAREVRGEAVPAMTNPPFSPIEEAIEDIREGRMVVVCDAEDRENEGDLTLAAQFATPGGDQLHGHPRPRADLPGAHAGALRRARPRPDGGQERVALPDRVHGLGRGARGHHHRDLRARPRAHDPGGDRPALAPAGPGPARATSSRSRPRPAACSSAPGRPRPRSTSRGWPGSTRRA